MTNFYDKIPTEYRQATMLAGIAHAVVAVLGAGVTHRDIRSPPTSMHLVNPLLQ